MSIVLLVSAGGAWTSVSLAASTAGTEGPTSKGPGYTVLHGGAGPSDLDALYAPADGVRWRLGDPAGIVTRDAPASSGCTPEGSVSVACSGDGVLVIYSAEAGGHVTVRGTPGTSGAVRVIGGPGDDDIAVGTGIGASVELSGGHDTIAGDPEHIDLVVQSSVIGEPVDVDVGAGTARHDDDLTTFPGARSVVALGPVSVRGSADADLVVVQGGTVAGREGDDDLSGSGSFDGGAGDDIVTVQGRSRVTCGPGVDRVMASRPLGALAGDCERVFAFGAKDERTDSWVDPRPHRVAGQPHRVRFRVSCGSRPAPCRGSLRLRVGRSERTVPVRLARRTTRWVALGAPGGRRLALGTRVSVDLTVPGARDPGWSAPVVR